MMSDNIILTSLYHQYAHAAPTRITKINNTRIKANPPPVVPVLQQPLLVVVVVLLQQVFAMISPLI